MKKIQTTNIAGSQDAPFIGATFDHLNEANLNSTSDIIKGILGSYTTNDVVILCGCIIAVTGGSIPGTGTATLTAGAIYYNGEIYEVDANAALATTNPQTLIWSIATTYRAGDPIEWSDGVSRNLHQIDKFVLSAGTAGAGLANYNATTVRNLVGSVRTTTAATTVSMAGVSVTSENYLFMYTVVNKMMYLTFKATIVINLGAAITEILLPLPSGVTKDTTGASSGYIWNGSASYSAPGSTTDYIMLTVESYDDGAEGQRVRLSRTSDGSTSMTVSNGVTLTLKGNIAMLIQ